MSEIKSYEILDVDFDSITPEAAQQEINRIEAEWQGDFDGHPLSRHDHPQHKDFVEHRSKLYDVTRRNMDTRPMDEQILQAAYDKGQARLAEKREQLIAEAKKEAELLEGLGFDPTKIPDDIQEYQLNALRMQRLNAQGNFSELRPLLEKELTTLRATGMDTFRTFVRDEGISSAERAEHIELILKRIYQANTAKAEKNKPPEETTEYKTYGNRRKQGD